MVPNDTTHETHSPWVLYRLSLLPAKAQAYMVDSWLSHDPNRNMDPAHTWSSYRSVERRLPNGSAWCDSRSTRTVTYAWCWCPSLEWLRWLPPRICRVDVSSTCPRECIARFCRRGRCWCRRRAHDTPDLLIDFAFYFWQEDWGKSEKWDN